MIRGTFIFAAGVGVGYSVAMRNQEPNGEVKKATSEFLRTMKGIAADAWLDVKNESAAAAKKVREEAEAAEEAKQTSKADPEGLSVLVDRLHEVLPHFDSRADEMTLLANTDANVSLTIGDLRAPFSLPETSDTEAKTAGATEPHDAGPQGETPS